MRKVLSAIAIALTLSIAAASDVAAQGGLEANGANKVAYSANTVDVVGPTAPITILSASVKASDKADFILQFTAECAISIRDPDFSSETASSVFGSFGFDSSFEIDNALANVRTWIEIDGVPVSLGAGDNGRVTLCRRQRDDATFNTLGIQDSSSFTTVQRTEQSEEFTATSQTNAFNWYAIDVGAGTHLVEVKAEIVIAASTATSEFAFGTPPNVTGQIGRRTLIVEPTNTNRVPK